MEDKKIRVNYVRVCCPFYEHKTAVSIECESFISESMFAVNKFRSAANTDKHAEKFCFSENWRKCPHARAMNWIYEIR